MLAVLGIVRAVPVWVWLVAAVALWGGWQRHRATAAVQEVAQIEARTAQQREAALAAAVHEQARIAGAQGAIANDTRKRLDMARTDAALARFDAGRLRDAAASAARNAASAAAAGDCAAAAGTAGMHAELLGRAVARAALLAEHADAAAAAGTACERSYDALITHPRPSAAP